MTLLHMGRTFADLEYRIALGDRAACAELGWLLAEQQNLRPHPAIDGAFIRALDQCWVRPETLALPIARYLGAKWPSALTGTPDRGEPELIEVLQDPLLAALLRATPALTPPLEILLARFRHSALRNLLGGKDIGAFLPLLTALAVRGAHSGYALTLPSEPRHAEDLVQEPDLVAELGRRLRKSDPSALALFCSYRSPQQQQLSAALAAGDATSRLIEEQIVQPRLRQGLIAKRLKPATPIDASSAIVAHQYEVHPYPAWIAEPAAPPMLPPAVLEALGPGGSEVVRSVLVAGCGTGQQAFAAASAWPRASILAIDLSRTSLAYAIDKADSFPHCRIQFALADLHSADSFGRFDVIEAFGVLHHLANPQLGLTALANALNERGLIGIGLYSAAARQELAEIRQRYGRDVAVSDEEVRRFRSWALTRHDFPDFLYAPDFYSLGGCRDLFFHVRERSYTLEEIATLLDLSGLRLVALQPPPRAQRRLGSSMPGPTDLAGWSAAERSHPKLFINMYELWVQRVGNE